MKKKFVTLLILSLILALNATPVFCTSSVETETYENETGTKECDVSVELEGTFTVHIPKRITLDGVTKTADYTITVMGDLGGEKAVKVTPDGTFEMSQAGKDNVTATVTQIKNQFTNTEISIMQEDVLVGTTTDGSVSATDLTAGEWSGVFNFTIEVVDTP